MNWTSLSAHLRQTSTIAVLLEEDMPSLPQVQAKSKSYALSSPVLAARFWKRSNDNRRPTSEAAWRPSPIATGNKFEQIFGHTRKTLEGPLYTPMSI